MRVLARMAIVAAVAVVAIMADAAEQQAQQQAQQQQGGVQVDGGGKGRPVMRIIGDDPIVELQEAPPAIEKKLDEPRAAAEKPVDKKARAEATEKAIDQLKKQMQQAQQQGPGGIGFGMQGSITIIGPDGVKHTHNFQKIGNGDGNGPMPDVQALIEKSLQAAGADLPDDVRDKLKQALKQQGNMQMQMPGGVKPKLDEADISRKLDRILDRLEKLEADVGAIKAAKPEKE